jgi:hypothetical protein
VTEFGAEVERAGLRGDLKKIHSARLRGLLLLRNLHSRHIRHPAVVAQRRAENFL